MERLCLGGRACMYVCAWADMCATVHVCVSTSTSKFIKKDIDILSLCGASDIGKQQN